MMPHPDNLAAAATQTTKPEARWYQIIIPAPDIDAGDAEARDAMPAWQKVVQIVCGRDRRDELTRTIDDELGKNQGGLEPQDWDDARVSYLKTARQADIWAIRRIPDTIVEEAEPSRIFAVSGIPYNRAQLRLILTEEGREYHDKIFARFEEKIWPVLKKEIAVRIEADTTAKIVDYEDSVFQKLFIIEKPSPQLLDVLAKMKNVRIEEARPDMTRERLLAIRHPEEGPPASSAPAP